MPNQFKGQVIDKVSGKKLEGVKVTISGPNIPPNTSALTDKEGNWFISLINDVNSTDIKLFFTKSGLQSKIINGPIPTAELEGYIDPEKGGTLDLQGLYESGRWKITSLQPESKSILDQELEDLFQFIKKHPGNTKIIITSSESQVTNADNEEGGLRTTEFRQILGSLAKARAEALQQYVNEFLDKKYNENLDIDPNQRPTIQFGEINRVGNELWERYYDQTNKLIERPDIINLNKQLLQRPEEQEQGAVRAADLSKYKKDQYTRINVEVITTPTIPDCLAGNLVIDIMYLKPGFHANINASDPGGITHNCNSAVFLLEAKGGNIDPNTKSNLSGGIILKRDDGALYASLNNKIGKNGANPSTEWEQTYVDSQGLINRGETVAEKFEREIRQYDNTYTRYQEPDNGKSSQLRSRRDQPGKEQFNNLLGKFKPLEKGNIFPIDPSTGSDIKPLTTDRAGERFNRFIINSQLLKEITGNVSEKIITFSLRCINSSTGIDTYTGLNTGKTDWYSDFKNKDYGWSNGCHKGVGTFNLYKIKPGTGSTDGKMIVEATTGYLTGKTPPNKDQLLWLFQYDVCKNEIIKKNNLVFENLNEIKGEDSGSD